MADATGGVLAPGYLPFARTSLRFMTELIQRLDDGGFVDPVWVRSLLVDADERYVNAVRNPASRTAPWRVACTAAERHNGGVMRHLLLGIHAHISYDLVASLAPRLAQPLDLGQRRDFERLNDLIATAVDGVQDEIRAQAPHWLGAADLLAGRWDELATWVAFRSLRGAAYDDAIAVRAGRLRLDRVEARAGHTARVLALLPL